MMRMNYGEPAFAEATAGRHVDMEIKNLSTEHRK